MNVAATTTKKRSALLGYFSLFTSVGTLLCCALPSLLVLLGFGASVASMLSFMPWLVALSRHKRWTFLIAGIFISLGFLNMYYIAPRLRKGECLPGNPSACDDASRLSKFLLWTSAVLYTAGCFVAFALGPILATLDKSD
jgi:mercuric ion transport protein